MTKDEIRKEIHDIIWWSIGLDNNEEIVGHDEAAENIMLFIDPLLK